MISREPELPKSMVRNRIDTIDLFILNKLNDKTYGWKGREDLSPEEKQLLDEQEGQPWLREGASISTLDKVIRKEMGIDITRTEVERRIQRLAANGVLLGLHSVIVDPTKLFDHVAHIYLKIPISSPLRTAALGWWEALDKIWTMDKKPGHGEIATDIVRIAGVIEGTGEYDLILLVYTNDMENVSSFLHRLAREGYIAKSMTQRVWTPTGIKFDPVTMPEFEPYVEAISRYSKVLEHMKKSK